MCHHGWWKIENLFLNILTLTLTQCGFKCRFFIIISIWYWIEQKNAIQLVNLNNKIDQNLLFKAAGILWLRDRGAGSLPMAFGSGMLVSGSRSDWGQSLFRWPTSRLQHGMQLDWTTCCMQRERTRTSFYQMDGRRPQGEGEAQHLFGHAPLRRPAFVLNG